MPRRNIGVAIEIPEPYGEQLRAARERFGDPQAQQIPPHVTLLPPTAVAADRLQEVYDHLGAVAAGEPPFELVLRGSGTFRPVSPVTFVPLAAGISDCERLEAQVRSGPLVRELRFNYHPHVTVAHDVDEAMLDRAFDEMAAFSARFVATGLTLFEQGSDKTWRPLVHFPFGESTGP
jgi:2'-5' RNA ligase